MAALASNITSNLPKGDPLNFGIYEDNDIDYKEVTKFLEWNKNELSKIAGISKQSVRTDDKIPQALKERLTEIAVICSLVAEFFEGNKVKTALWFKTPNPMIGDITPRDMIRLGRSKKLIRFIMEAREENGQERREQP